MRSSVPCSSWIDSFSLLDIQVVSLMKDYYASLACQVDVVRNDPSRKTPLVLAVRGLRNHTTIEISLSHAYGLRFGPETHVHDQGRSKIVMSLLCSRLSETGLSILGRQYQGNALIEPIGLRGVPDGLSHTDARPKRRSGKSVLPRCPNVS